jgi:hypothetical protein
VYVASSSSRSDAVKMSRHRPWVYKRASCILELEGGVIQIRSSVLSIAQEEEERCADHFGNSQVSCLLFQAHGLFNDINDNEDWNWFDSQW